ncbi:MAG: glycosyltransferase family 4 protein [Acidimicrobiia bacterium]|nr:glycosyltransferase family 4 protein [Acidimicrobiia bacterium]
MLTAPHPDAEDFDREQPFRIERVDERVLLPTSGLVGRIDRLAEEVDARLVLLDPALPAGPRGTSSGPPVRTGAPRRGGDRAGRVPVGHRACATCSAACRWSSRAGGYPPPRPERAAAAELPTVVVPPGVDVERFHPLAPDERLRGRERFGLPIAGTLVVSVSRLVPRKGMDVLIEAAGALADRHRRLHVAIAGDGRDRRRLERLALRTGAPVTFLGRVEDDELPRLYGSADIFAMLCRNRWGGLEQEGFGIVFLEAGGIGALLQVAGDSGGADEAVSDGETGVVVRDPENVEAVRHALARLVDYEELRVRMGVAARERAVGTFAYDVLAAELREAIEAAAGPGDSP